MVLTLQAPSVPDTPQAAAPALVLPVLKHPLIILTPTPLHCPSSRALNIMRSQCQHIVQCHLRFSVTYSPVWCPAGKNHFYSIAPHWWLKSDGTWEHRDGQRNPAADIPTCQRELEQMAQAVHTLSLGTKYLVDQDDQDLREQCQIEADVILRQFFLDDKTRMIPEVEYSQYIPGKSPVKGNANFVISTRYLILVAQALTILPPDLPCRPEIEQWFDAHIRWMKASPQGLEASTQGKKMETWYHTAIYLAQLASYLAISSPEQSYAHANQYMRDLITIHPNPATLFPSARLGTRPRHNTLFALEPLFILASLSLTIPSAAPGVIADMMIVEWLERVVDWVKRVQPGPAEVEVDSDQRRGAKIAWFYRLLRRWSGLEVEEGGLEGKYWEKGWREWSVLAWEMI